jgi:hypothetical protein
MVKQKDVPKEQQQQLTPAQTAREYANSAFKYALDNCGMPFPAEAKEALRNSFMKGWEATEHRLDLDLANAFDHWDGGAA